MVVHSYNPSSLEVEDHEFMSVLNDINLGAACSPWNPASVVVRRLCAKPLSFVLRVFSPRLTGLLRLTENICYKVCFLVCKYQHLWKMCATARFLSKMTMCLWKVHLQSGLWTCALRCLLYFELFELPQQDSLLQHIHVKKKLLLRWKINTPSSTITYGQLSLQRSFTVHSGWLLDFVGESPAMQSSLASNSLLLFGRHRGCALICCCCRQ